MSYQGLHSNFLYVYMCLTLALWLIIIIVKLNQIYMFKNFVAETSNNKPFSLLIVYNVIIFV